MQKETLDKLRRYIDLAATHSSLSTTFPMGRWPEHEVERERAWQEFVEAVQGDDYAFDLLGRRFDNFMWAMIESIPRLLKPNWRIEESPTTRLRKAHWRKRP